MCSEKWDKCDLPSSEIRECTILFALMHSTAASSGPFLSGIANTTEMKNSAKAPDHMTMIRVKSPSSSRTEPTVLVGNVRQIQVQPWHLVFHNGGPLDDRIGLEYYRASLESRMERKLAFPPRPSPMFIPFSPNE